MSEGTMMYDDDILAIKGLIKNVLDANLDALKKLSDNVYEAKLDELGKLSRKALESLEKQNVKIDHLNNSMYQQKDLIDLKQDVTFIKNEIKNNSDYLRG